jgi:hypothetical protein
MRSQSVPISSPNRIIEKNLATLSLPLATAQPAALKLAKVATFPALRVLAWHDDVLYASRGHKLLRARVQADTPVLNWEQVGFARPPWWRKLTCSSRPTTRLFRDGFHALAILRSGELVAAVPNAIVTLFPGEQEFRTTHRVALGTRPLHFAVTPAGRIFWGEYFDNRRRAEVHIYVSTDRGAHWDIAHTFPANAIRHVHNIVYDQWEDCLWVLTGDNGAECRIIRASCDFRHVETVLSGSQQTRCVALIPAPDGVYFSSDTPLERNYIYHLDRRGNLRRLSELSSSSICGCRVGDTVFFSTMVEPSRTNPDQNVRIYGSPDGIYFKELLSWQKDSWPMKLFQYGNAFLPDGNNTSGLLAATTIAVKNDDCETGLWRVAH